MKDLPRVTLVAVTSVKIPETIRALKKSMAGLRFHEVLLLTDAKISLDDAGIRVVNIEKLDYIGYSRFMFHRLKDYIKSDFALVVQHDGYVVRPESWNDEFLGYDYIGAPWPKGAHFTPEGVEVRVGNGGFSFRSRKLLEAPAKLGLSLEAHSSGYHNEDGFLCIEYRAALEKAGIRFAPVEVAARFSREKRLPDSVRYPFGFHNLDNLPSVRTFVRRLGAAPLGRIASAALARVRTRAASAARLSRRLASSWRNELSPCTDAAEYRKHFKVYDIFTFFNELDLLEMRLAILDPYVDHFVIAESTTTFSGKPKPLYYEENKERFKKWHGKIIHQVTRDAPADRKELEKRFRESAGLSSIDTMVMGDVLSHATIGARGIDWTNELYQKESIKKALASLSDDDICFVSDVDEIWDPRARIDYGSDAVFKLRQKMYAYYLNNRSSEAWVQPIASKYKNIKDAYLNDLRSEKKTKYTYVRNGGWHFTNMGGADQIRKKLESYGHQEFNTAEIKSRIEKRMSENKDFIGRRFRFWTDESDLPQYILDNRQKYAAYFK